MSKYLRYFGAGLRVTLAPLAGYNVLRVALGVCLTIATTVWVVLVAIAVGYGCFYIGLTIAQLVLPLLFPDVPGSILAIWLDFRLPYGEYAAVAVVVFWVAAFWKKIYQRGVLAVEGNPQAGQPLKEIGLK